MRAGAIGEEVENFRVGDLGTPHRLERFTLTFGEELSDFEVRFQHFSQRKCTPKAPIDVDIDPIGAAEPRFEFSYLRHRAL